MYDETDRFNFIRDPSNNLLIGPSGCHYENERSAMYYDQLKFCGCGDPVAAHEFTLDCLSCFDRDAHGFEPDSGIVAIKKIVESRPDDAAYFIAYVLDNMNLTEHGGSVGGSWLTDRGKQFIEIGAMTEEDDN